MTTEAPKDQIEHLFHGLTTKQQATVAFFLLARTAPDHATGPDGEVARGMWRDAFAWAVKLDPTMPPCQQNPQSVG